jgi:hypothetical protein
VPVAQHSKYFFIQLFGLSAFDLFCQAHKYPAATSCDTKVEERRCFWNQVNARWSRLYTVVVHLLNRLGMLSGTFGDGHFLGCHEAVIQPG